MTYSIYDTEEIQQYTVKQLAKIDKALVAAAYTIRDNARQAFVNNGKYKGIGVLSEGIMLGRLVKNGGVSSITVHGFGYNDTKKQTYKTRFFILGTLDRQVKKRNGTTLKQPYSIGNIERLDSIENAMKGADNTLISYIRNALNADIQK